MRVRRGIHNDIGASPGRQAVGVIATGARNGSSSTDGAGWLATTIDLTLFQHVQGFEEYDPPPIGALVGAPIRRASIQVATILEYDHPDTAAQIWRPYVRCTPTRDIGPRFTELLDEGDIRPGLGVQMNFDDPMSGSVATGVQPGNFMPERALPPVPQFQVRLPSTITGTSGRGAAVTTTVGGATVLVGMVLEIFRQPDASTLLTCYPAFLFDE